MASFTPARLNSEKLGRRLNGLKLSIRLALRWLGYDADWASGGVVTHVSAQVWDIDVCTQFRYGTVDSCMSSLVMRVCHQLTAEPLWDAEPLVAFTVHLKLQLGFNVVPKGFARRGRGILEISSVTRLISQFAVYFAKGRIFRELSYDLSMKACIDLHQIGLEYCLNCGAIGLLPRHCCDRGCRAWDSLDS